MILPRVPLVRQPAEDIRICQAADVEMKTKARCALPGRGWDREETFCWMIAGREGREFLILRGFGATAWNNFIEGLVG